jgi:plasmid replication initiation protein
MEIVPLNFDNLDPKSIEGASIRKHNDLIEAKYQLPNLQEQRVIIMLLAQIKPNDEDFKGYRIAITDFAKLVGLRVDGVYEELEKALKNLMTRVISIKKGKSFLLMNWLSSAEYIHGSGYVELAFDPKLKPYLLQLQDHFTQYKLDKVLHFKSIYSIRLYELLKKDSFKVKNGIFNVFFEYEELREKFGIGKKEYLLFANFKMKTIEVATREISDKTDLFIIDVKYGKTGRKITNITFCVGVRSENETKLREDNLRLEDIKKDKNENHPVIDSLVDLGFSLEIAKTYKNKYGVKQIERNIAYTLAKKQAGEVKNLPAYLSKAIESDWGNGWEKEHLKEEEKKKKIALAEEQKKKEEAQKSEKNAKENEMIINNFFLLELEQRTEIFKAFLSIEDAMKEKVNGLFKELGENAIKNKVFYALFLNYLKTKVLK